MAPEGCDAGPGMREGRPKPALPQLGPERRAGASPGHALQAHEGHTAVTRGNEMRGFTFLLTPPGGKLTPTSPNTRLPALSLGGVTGEKARSQELRGEILELFQY